MNPECDGKMKYPTKRAAQLRVEGQMDKHRKRPNRAWGKHVMQIYRCPCCGHWHVGAGGKDRKQVRPAYVHDRLLDMLPPGARVRLRRQ